jgi:mRNA turnover protein 4
VSDIQECVDNYARLFVFDVENMRNQSMKDVREHWQGSRFFLGKNKVMQVGLGHDPNDEYRANLYKASKEVTGSRGLFFTSAATADVEKFFNEFSESSFARSGFVATHDFALKAGILKDQPFSIETHLRKLGLPVRLINGEVELLVDTTICQEGDTLTPEQASLLQLFGVIMAEFQLSLVGMWHDSVYTDLMPGGGGGGKKGKAAAADDSDDDDDDEMVAEKVTKASKSALKAVKKASHKNRAK